MGDSTKAIDFSILPYLANLAGYSYSAWVRQSLSPFGAIVSHSVDLGVGRRGNALSISALTLHFESYKTPNDGRWQATNAFPADTDWHHVALTYDNTTATADPVIYVDGVSVTVTETSVPSGTSDDDSDCPLILFNWAPDPTVSGQRYFSNLVGGLALKDIRIYNRILTADEVAELAAGEDDYTVLIDSGLLFMGIFAPSAFIEEFVGDTISGDDFVLDVIHRAAGIPYNDDPNNMLTGETIS
jgi:hypothetical protein